MRDKLKSLIHSRRFWAALGALLTAVLQDAVGLDRDEATLIVGIFGAWILGDSIKHTE